MVIGLPQRRAVDPMCLLLMPLERIPSCVPSNGEDGRSRRRCGNTHGRAVRADEDRRMYGAAGTQKEGVVAKGWCN